MQAGIYGTKANVYRKEKSYPTIELMHRVFVIHPHTPYSKIPFKSPTSKSVNRPLNTPPNPPLLPHCGMLKLTSTRLLRYIHISLILLPQRPLHRLSPRDPIYPRHQVRERLHIILAEPCEFPPLDPRPSAHIRDAVFPLGRASEIVAWLAGVLA